MPQQSTNSVTDVCNTAQARLRRKFAGLPIDLGALPLGFRTVLVFLAFVAFAWAANGQDAADRWSQLDSFIRRVQLDRFRVALVEDRLAAAPPADQLELAKELSQLYLQQLYERGEHGQSAGDVEAKLRQLLADFSSLDEPKMRAAMLYGDFARLETRFQAAMDAPHQPALRAGALDSAQQFLQQLAQSGLADSGAQPSAAPDSSIIFFDEPPVAPPEEEAWRDQVSYLQAWASYYAGVLTTDPDARLELWQQANLLFRQILQIQEAADLQEIQDGWLDVSASSLARTALGLGLSEQALGHDAQASVCFRLLQGAEAYPELRRHWMTWRINSFLFPGLVEPLRVWLESEADRGDWAAEDFAALAYAADLAHRTRQVDPERSAEFAALLESLAGFLVQQNRLELVDQWIRTGMIAPESFRDDFTGRLLTGRKLFLQAEDSGNAADYQAADRQFESALTVDSTNLTPQQTAQVTFLRGWCLLRMQQYDQAIVQFRLAQRLADPWDAEFAAQAAWMTIECQLRGASPGPDQAPQIQQALRRFQTRYPGSPLIAQAQFAEARWEARTTSSPSAIAQLESTARSNPQWEAAQLEAARLHQSLWMQAQANSRVDDLDTHHAALERVAQRLADDREADPRTAAQALLLLLDVELSDERSPAETWQPRFAQIESLLSQVSTPGALTVDLQWQKFRAARRRNDEAEARLWADTLVEQTSSRPIREAALLYLADRYQHAVEQAAESERPAALREAHTFYLKMTEVLGTDPETLTRSRNAFLALQRLGDLEVTLGEDAQADARFAQLIAAAPRELAVLQRAAASKQRLQQWPAAIDLWRTIARGVTPGTDDWLQAKYQLVVGLQKTGEPSALGVLDQTLQLMPVLSADWRERFATLRASLTAEPAR